MSEARISCRVKNFAGLVDGGMRKPWPGPICQDRRNLEYYSHCSRSDREKCGTSLVHIYRTVGATGRYKAWFVDCTGDSSENLFSD